MADSLYLDDRDLDTGVEPGVGSSSVVHGAIGIASPRPTNG